MNQLARPADQPREPDDRAAVVGTDGDYRVLATEAIPAGHTIFVIRGSLARTPTKYSVQIGLDAHLGPDEGDPDDTSPWRFTNHSCQPNATIVDRRLVAIRGIAGREEVTFNYNTTEFSLAEPFQCRCGSTRCSGTIAGFRHLAAEEQQRLRPLLAPYLQRWLAKNGT